MAAIDRIGTMVPDIILDHVIIENPNDNTTLRIKMHLEEYIYSDGTGTWATDFYFRGRLAVLLAVTVDGTTTEKLMSLSYLTTTRDVDVSKTDTYQKIKKEFVIDDFGFNPEETKDITVSVRTQLAPGTLQWDYVQEVPIQGKASSVSVMKNGTPETRTTGYFLGDSFYTGPRTQLENGRWVTGNAQNASSEFLIERDVPNVKVFDSRNVLTVPQLLTLLSEGSAPAGSAGSGIGFVAGDSAPPQDSTETAEEKVLFSDISATRDRDSLLTYVFTFDYSAAYKENSVYPDLYSTFSPRLKDRALRMSTLKKMALYRHREDIENSSEELVVVSGEASGDKFVDAYTEDGTIKEEEFHYQKGILETRTFSGIDLSFKDISAGKYKYRAETQIKDGIFSVLRFQETDLIETEKAFQEYLNEAFSRTTPATAADYNPDYGELTDEFLEDINRRYDFLNRPNIRALISLSEAVYFYPAIGARVSGDAYFTNVFNSLRHWLSPITGDYFTMSEAQSLFAPLLTAIGRYKSRVSEATQALSADADPNVVSRGNLLYNIDYEFPNLFNATENFKTGLYFLSMKKSQDARTTLGLKRMTSPNWQARIKDEVDNYFDGQSLNFTITNGDKNVTSVGSSTSYSYLTPTSIRLGDTFYTIGTNSGVVAEDGTIVESLSSGDSTQKYKRVLAELRNSRARDAGFGTDLNMDVKPIEDEEYEGVYPIGTTDPEADGQTTLSIDEFMQVLDSSGFDNPFDALRVINIENSEGGAELSLRGLNGTDGLTLSEGEFDKEVPNYFKAIIAAGTPAAGRYSDILDSAIDGDLAPYSLLFGSMAQIEYLKEFKNGNVNDPSYKLLTKAAFERNSGSNLLCRLKKYEGENIGFVRSNDAPIYNNHFVLECPPATRNLQDDLNAATTILDINAILDDIDASTAGGATSAGAIDTGLCNALADEKAIEEMAGFLAASPPPLNLLPLLTGETAPFDGILMDNDSVDKIVSEKDALEKEVETLKGEIE